MEAGTAWRSAAVARQAHSDQRLALASVPGEEGLSELAPSIAEEFRDWQQSLLAGVVQLDQIAGLPPNSFSQ